MDAETYVITENTKYVFNSDGKIAAIEDETNSNKIQMNYRPNGNIDKVIDSVGRQYLFEYAQINGILSVSAVSAYNPDGTPIYIDNCASKVSYDYQKVGDKNLVRSVKYADGKTATYQYNTSGNLVSANGISKKAEISYQDRLVSSISDGDHTVTVSCDSYSLENIGDSPIYSFTDNYGNTDTLLLLQPGTNPLAVYDKDWNIVYRPNLSNIVTNGFLYNYFNLDETQQSLNQEYPEWTEKWESEYGHGGMLSYLPNGGIDFQENQINYISQQTNENVKNNTDYLIGVVCSEVYAESFLVSDTLGVNIPITKNGITFTKVTTPYDVEEVPIDIRIEGNAAIKSVYLYDTFKAVKEIEEPIVPDKCPCSECETLDCTCRCLKAEDCKCTQCLSPVVKTKDRFGNLLSSVRSNNGLELKQSNTYTENGDFSTSSVDENGTTFHYDYNTGAGLLESITNQKGTLANYKYDAIGTLKRVEAQNNDQLMANDYLYQNDRISSISHNGFSYNFNYNNYGNLLSTKVNNQILASYVYEKDKIKQTDFANGQKISYIFDRPGGNITGIDINHDNQMEYTYRYNPDGSLAQADDYVNNVKTVINDNGAIQYDRTSSKILYSSISDKVSQDTTEVVNGQTLKYHIDKRSENGAITSSMETYNNHLRILSVNTSDNMRRLAEKKVKLADSNTSVKTSLVYKIDDQNHTTGTQLQSMSNQVTNSGGGVLTTQFQYEYEPDGKITKEVRTDDRGSNSTSAQYTYDVMQQLVSETIDLNEKIDYTYDAAGNLLSKKTSNLEDNSIISNVVYGYDSAWKDLLISFNGQEIQHDQLGNVVNDGKWQYTWKAGRQLSLLSSSEKNIAFQYDDSGLRTKKTVTSLDGKTQVYRYFWANDILVGMELDGNQIRFLYESGNLTGFIVNEKDTYFYCKNLQGDIYEVINASGDVVAQYSYDSWGNVRSATGRSDVLSYNPFGYRSYQQDKETGLYYLQTRYYNPEWGRFISADTNLDTQTSIIGTNIFVYGDNNPIMNTDSTGKSIDLGSLNEEQSSNLFLKLFNFLVSLPKGNTQSVEIEAYKVYITAQMGRLIRGIAYAVLTVIAGVVTAAISAYIQGLGIATKTIIASLFGIGVLGGGAKAFLTSILEIPINKLKELDPFRNIIEGDYIYGWISVRKELTEGPYKTVYLYSCFFVFGPAGTSLDLVRYGQEKSGSNFE